MEVKIKRYKSGKNKGCIRKNEVKLDKYDSWCIPWTISQIMAPLLEQLKDTKHGYGAIKKEDVPQDIHSTYNDLFSEDAYNWVLDELIWMFTVTSTDFEDEPEVYKFGESKVEDGLSNWLSDCEEIPGKKEEYDAYYRRVDNAWRLFGKYARTLWD